MLRSPALLSFALSFGQLHAQQYTISTIAGTGTPATSGNGGAALSADLIYPLGIALDTVGNLYFAQGAEFAVRKLDPGSGLVQHVAGTGLLGYGGDGGPAAAAGLAAPYDLAFDPQGDLYISEADAFRIRRIDMSTDIIGTFAGTLSPGNNTEVPALSANLDGPRGVAFNAQGDLFIALVGNECVRHIDADSSYLHAFAGTGAPGSTGFSGDGGPALAAQFYGPYGVEVAPNGNVYIADLNNLRIRMVEATSGTITTVAGSGLLPYDGDGIPATAAAIGKPRYMAFDAAGNLYFTDFDQHRIRKVDASTGLISTIAGTGTAGFSGDGQLATTANINTPAGIAVDTAGRIYFSDSYNHRIRMLTPVDDTSVRGSAALASISVHPSPATEVLHVSALVRGAVVVLDARGRVMHRARLNGTVLSIPVMDWTPGLYTVKVEGAMPVRVVVE